MPACVLISCIPAAAPPHPGDSLRRRLTGSPGSGSPSTCLRWQSSPAGCSPGTAACGRRYLASAPRLARLLAQRLGFLPAAALCFALKRRSVAGGDVWPRHGAGCASPLRSPRVGASPSRAAAPVNGSSSAASRLAACWSRLTSPAGFALPLPAARPVAAASPRARRAQAH